MVSANSSQPRGDAESQPTGPQRSRLPAVRLRLNVKRVFVSVPDSKLSARALKQHLQANEISPVTIKKLRSKSHQNSSFCVEVADIEYEAMYEPAIWNEGSVIKDYSGYPQDGQVVETA